MTVKMCYLTILLPNSKEITTPCIHASSIEVLANIEVQGHVCGRKCITFVHTLMLLPLLSSECQEVAAG